MSEQNVLEKASDDGEPSQTAGAPMLDILKKQDIVNVVVIVTRYFGGILLGTGGLVKAYSDATILSIEKAELKEIKVGESIRFKINYDELQKLQYICNKNDILIQDTEFNEFVDVTVLVEDDKKMLLNINYIEKETINENVCF